jgi:hypothetical protein
LTDGKGPALSTIGLALASRSAAQIVRHWQSYLVETERFARYIRRMEKYRSQMLEVSVTACPPGRWEWEVTSNGEMIANGFENGRLEAKFEGYNAMFLLLAAGWNP